VLYSNARFSIAGVLISAFFFILFQWRNIASEVWLGWITAILLINLPRLILVKRFYHKLDRGEITYRNVQLWERRFYYGVFLSSLSWSAVSLFPFQHDLLKSLLFTALLLVGMSSASIVTLITSLMMGLTFLTATMLPLIARSLLSGEMALMVLALLGLTYYVIFANMAYRLHHTVIDNISLKIENEELSLKDVLTGLWNRRQLYLFAEQLFMQKERSQETFSIIMLDLDHFKDFNDSSGHLAGDRLLSQIAYIITSESRSVDLVVRYGGEEFMVVLPRADGGQAARVAERIRLGVREQTAVSISAGIAGYRNDETFEQMIARADKALYQAKEQGRDRIVVDEAMSVFAV
jgi:diguanylate cyclase (GGDEF)-like protein